MPDGRTERGSVSKSLVSLRREGGRRRPARKRGEWPETKLGESSCRARIGTKFLRGWVTCAREFTQPPRQTFDPHFERSAYAAGTSSYSIGS